jgi:3-hydroxybutyryl-CoA dehydratase
MSNIGYVIGDSVSETVVVTEKMVALFAEMSGDNNPLHMDEEYAKSTRFGRRIAHGMLSGALISRVLAMKLGFGGVYLSQTMKFMNPIYIGDTVIIEVTVAAIREERGIASCTTIVRKSTGEVCVKGEAMIMSPKNL